MFKVHGNPALSLPVLVQPNDPFVSLSQRLDQIITLRGKKGIAGE